MVNALYLRGEQMNKKYAMISLMAIIALTAVMAVNATIYVDQCNTIGIYAGQCRHVYVAPTLSYANMLVAQFNALPPYVLHGTYFQVAVV